MRSLTSIPAAIAALGLLATVGQAGSNQLDAKSIKGLFPGYFEAKVEGYRVQFSGTGNGMLNGQAFGREDQGRWYIQGNRLCVAWKEWTKGEAKCGAISQKDGWFVASNGSGQLLKFRRAMIAQK